MNGFTNTISSSIGKKSMMAITGLAFCLFLLGHLAGNLSIYAGWNAFDRYAEKLHTLGILITIIEIGLLFFALIHVSTGILLFYQNRMARSKRYTVKKNAGGQTIGSATMPYTGILLLIFIIMHLMNFHFVDKTQRTISQIVADLFTNPLYVAIYIAAMAVAALHVSHGLWSAFQSLGADNKKYMPGIRMLSILFSLLVGIGFGSLPIFISVMLR